MRTRKDIIEHVLECGVVAIVRLSTGDRLVEVAEAVYAGGISVIEFTLNTPRALEAIRECRTRLPDCVIGAGTVLNGKAAQSAMEAGAEIIVSPGTKAEVIETAHRGGRVAVPGAYTPTEICTALDLYADIVKLFPANGLGPGYIKDVLGPLNDAKLLPTGGVTPENAHRFFEAGAAAVGAGGGVVNDATVAAGDFAGITANAQAMKSAVDAARKELV